MIDMQRLNDHSRHFASQLFRQWPEWIRHARYDPYEDFEKEALLVEVPSPVAGERDGLYITSSEWEISVGFGESFHTRFGTSGDANDAGDPGDPTEENFYVEAMQFIQDFVEERIVLATAYADKEWLGAWKIDLRSHELGDIEVEDGVLVKVRSWNGSHDRNIMPD